MSGEMKRALHLFFLLQKAYLDRIRFAEEERLMRVYDDMGLEVIRGKEKKRKDIYKNG